MGYAAARYGHVMFPENVYEPALHCAELLLDGVGKGNIGLQSSMFYFYFEVIWAILVKMSIAVTRINLPRRRIYLKATDE